ncbi:uncharacterized protein EKO05_0010741 [Ascochyta rabiei]|uniref:Uncharacterized protein n=1 Tax=Didymella rabiei TaxID=5454 RepID=A0A163M012_DIDRA|nr:uncharacterized protein EKO05_0010741 [Ascochyta rabiei]KZM28276.1 hypothetical protein ST47_g588 [Ascochyta rabiei]UPX20512.1 hypothetical protein EKO05_0010741 [Ascochyta rabiei]
MPLRAELPIVRVEHGSMHTIETRNPENLFGLWSVFSKCSPAMEDGKRYENMAWRLWARETFCCQPDHVVSPQWAFDQEIAASASTTTDVPELSTSVASDDSMSIDPVATSQHRSDSSASRPDLRRHDSATSNARGKHMTPTDLEKVVNSIQEKKVIEPLSPLPPQLAPPTTKAPQPDDAVAPRSASPPLAARRCAPELSTSTFATARGSDDMSAAGSEASTSTDMSQHSVVRGFEPGHISTSMRSSTNLAPTPILKQTPSFIVKPPPSRAEPMKKKQPMFTLGGSSDEDASSSLEAYSLAQRSALSDNLRKAGPMRKTTSFANQISLRQYQEAISESEGAIESDSDEPDESAIEEEDSGDDWEDDDDEADESHQSSVQATSMFPRVDSKPNLTSHRSLLTTMMHEGDRAQAMQNAAQRQQPPPIRRSRTTTPNGPSIGNSPQEDSGLMMRQQTSRAKPIIMTTSNVHPPALSPRTTRRLMLQNELSGSLRQNLLWERQQKNATTNAAVRRAATTTDLEGMSTMAQAQPMHTSAKNPNSYFDQGLGSYHTKGW